MADNARHQHLARRQPCVLPHSCSCRTLAGLEGGSLRLHLEDHLDDVLERQFVGARAKPAAPAQMIAHPLFRKPASAWLTASMRRRANFAREASIVGSGFSMSHRPGKPGSSICNITWPSPRPVLSRSDRHTRSVCSADPEATRLVGSFAP